MHEIVRQMWDRGLTMKRWAALNGFNHRYVALIIAGKRGQWNAGTAKKIKEALKDQGYSDKAA